MSNKSEKKSGLLTRCLNGIERVGNALPHPVTLFAIMALAVVVISAICAAMGVSATVAVYRLLSAAFLTSLMLNFMLSK